MADIKLLEGLDVDAALDKVDVWVDGIEDKIEEALPGLLADLFEDATGIPDEITELIFEKVTGIAREAVEEVEDWILAQFDPEERAERLEGRAAVLESRADEIEDDRPKAAARKRKRAERKKERAANLVE